jgi:hypothetical protein
VRRARSIRVGMRMSGERKISHKTVLPVGGERTTRKKKRTEVCERIGFTLGANFFYSWRQCTHLPTYQYFGKLLTNMGKTLTYVLAQCALLVE